MKIVCISDTHNNEPELPEGDILVHAGDATIHGYRVEAYRQLCWLESQLHKYKYIFFTPGNHDLYFEKNLLKAKEEALLAGIILLHNELFEFDVNGKTYRLWMSAHTPNYHDWAFMLNENEIIEAWEKIPQNLDVLVTHAPPLGILDKSYRDEHIGCKWLVQRVLEIKPQVHIFGHAHEGRGMFNNGVTQFVNAATKPVVIEIP